MSGNVELAKLLWGRGAREGAAFALSNAVTKGYLEMTRWLLANCKTDLNWKNYEGKTALMIATEKGEQHSDPSKDGGPRGIFESSIKSRNLPSRNQEEYV
jgi:hypothetical protein